VTPNVQESEVFVGQKITNLDDLRQAARQMHGRFGCAILAKGGHLRDGKRAVDVLFDGKREVLLSAPFVRGIKTHGTGCTYSAAITAYLARGHALEQSVVAAKKYISRAIRQTATAGGYHVLGWQPPLAQRLI
jgi:hydroxymethylpyrimidine/phosphomethylpyrimidine kinase